MKPCSTHWKRFREVIGDDPAGGKGAVGITLTLQLLPSYTEKDIFKLQDQIDGDGQGCMFCFLGEEKAGLLMDRVKKALELSPDEFKKRFVDRAPME